MLSLIIRNGARSPVYTRRGDRGETSLFGPTRVSKDDPRVEAYGTMDELNSWLGLIIASTRDRALASSLKEIQKMLFVAGGDAACELAAPQKVPRITRADTLKIERMTNELLAKLPPLKSFILPGGTPSAAMLHVARSIARRAERRLVTASRSGDMNPELLPFFNRLSSYMFNLARLTNMKARRKEVAWKS
jgi:cob(I)alamin adenosyltransferase